MTKRMMVVLVLFLLIGCSANSGSVTEQPLVQYVTTTPRPTKVAVKPTATVEPTSGAEIPPTEIVLGIPAVTITPRPAASIPAPAVPIVDPGDSLPAPLYLLSELVDVTDTRDTGPKQIWRVSSKGTGYAKLTNESTDIESFDISPVTGEIVYTTGMQVIKIAFDGTNRTVLWESPELQNGSDGDDYNNLLNPRWSPDGQEIMVGYGGIAVMPITGGEPTIIIFNGASETAAAYVPHSWSPDGKRMLIFEHVGSDRVNMLIVDRETLEQIAIRFEQGSVCCHATWAPDGASIVFGNDSFGGLNPGLWRVNTVTGEITTYGTVDPINGPWLRANSPAVLHDGRLLALTSIVSANQGGSAFLGGSPIPHQLSQVAEDGSVTILNNSFVQASEALWFPDGTGAVMYEPYWGTNVYIVFVDENYVQGLLLTGSHMRWGR